MKVIKKITIILIILFLINFNFANIVKAADDFSSVTDEAGSFVTTGKNQANALFGDTADLTSNITGSLLPIAQALRTIGIGVILCVGAFMGIKWVTAKPDEQAKLKQQSVGLLVAAVVVIGAYTIWSIALRVVSQL